MTKKSHDIELIQTAVDEIETGLIMLGSPEAEIGDIEKHMHMCLDILRQILHSWREDPIPVPPLDNSERLKIYAKNIHKDKDVTIVYMTGVYIVYLSGHDFPAIVVNEDDIEAYLKDRVNAFGEIVKER